MAQNFVRHAFLLFRQEKAYGAIHLYALKCGDFWLRILKQEVRSCANLSRHLGTLLEGIEINGKVLRANAFSFSEPQEVHRDYVFSVLYHKV